MFTNGMMDTNGSGRRRRSWPEALKREIVAASFEPGASASVVARRYDVNTNQLFIWRIPPVTAHGDAGIGRFKGDEAARRF